MEIVLVFVCECNSAPGTRCYIHGFVEALEENVLTLETERLILRDFIREDWEALNAIVIDPEVKRYSYFAFWDGAERREWFAWLVQDVDNQNRDAYSANFVKEEGDNHAIINPATRFYLAPSNA